MKMGKIQYVRLPKEIDRQVREMAEREQRPLSNMLRVLVQRGLEHKPEPDQEQASQAQA